MAWCETGGIETYRRCPLRKELYDLIKSEHVKAKREFVRYGGQIIVASSGTEHVRYTVGNYKARSIALLWANIFIVLQTTSCYMAYGTCSCFKFSRRRLRREGSIREILLRPNGYLDYSNKMKDARCSASPWVDQTFRAKVRAAGVMQRALRHVEADRQSISTKGSRKVRLKSMDIVTELQKRGPWKGTARRTER